MNYMKNMFLGPSPSSETNTLLPPNQSMERGKSMPMMDTFTDFSMVGVYETRKGTKFVQVDSERERFKGKYVVLIFMDNKLTDLEVDEWKDFSKNLKEFQ